jgi:hypothetical protein
MEQMMERLLACLEMLVACLDAMEAYPEMMEANQEKIERVKSTHVPTALQGWASNILDKDPKEATYEETIRALGEPIWGPASTCRVP